jgi:hypothetical protein
MKTGREQTCQVKCPGADAQSASEIVICGALLGFNGVRDFRRKLKMGKDQGMVSKERGTKKNIVYWVC